MLIHRNVIKSLHHATAPEDTRYALGAIYIDPASRECIATDGRILIRAAAPTLGDADDYPTNIHPGHNPEEAGIEVDGAADVTGMLDAEALLIAAKATPRSHGIPILQNVAVVSRTSFVTTDIERTQVQTGRALDGNFPQWRKVMTGPPENATTFTLSAKLLDVLVKATKASHGPQGHVTFHIIKDQGKHGVYFACGGGNGDSPKIDGIVMPFRT